MDVVRKLPPIPPLQPRTLRRIFHCAVKVPQEATDKVGRRMSDPDPPINGATLGLTIPSHRISFSQGAKILAMRRG